MAESAVYLVAFERYGSKKVKKEGSRLKVAKQMSKKYKKSSKDSTTGAMKIVGDVMVYLELTKQMMSLAFPEP